MGIAKIRQVLPFPIEYQEACFSIWFNNGQPGAQRLMTLVPPYVSDDGKERRPSKKELEKWYEANGWEERADSISFDAQQNFNTALVHRRVALMEKIAADGAFLVDKGLDYLKTHDFENTHVALRAVEKGIELQQKASGMAAVLQSILTMSNDELQKAIAQLTSDVEAVIEVDSVGEGGDEEETA